MDWLKHFADLFVSTVGDVLPIVATIVVFQYLVLRKPLPDPWRLAIGLFYVVLGMALFLIGLDTALFPIGEAMARQLTDPTFISKTGNPSTDWHQYYWVFLFATAIGFSTTIAEPALLAVAIKAHEVSGGAIGVRGLRVAVAIGVGAGLALGSFRIVTGHPLHYYIIAGYALVVVQTFFAPRLIIALAYDSGGVTTSTVTVPLVTALGLGLAGTVPGRSQVLDGFGLIAFASLFPIVSVMAYAQLSDWRARRSHRHARKE